MRLLRRSRTLSLDRPKGAHTGDYMSSMAHVLGFFIIACSQHPELEVPGNQGIPCVWMFRYIRLHKLTILLYI